MNQKLLDNLFLALAAGDSLGSTSEFVPQQEVPQLFNRMRPSDWPFKQVGGGSFNWPPGAPTDDTDMALAIVRSATKHRTFNGADVADRFVAWLETGPRDIGGTTRRTLEAIRAGVPWHHGGMAEYRQNPGNAANGSLMRNGVMKGIADSLMDAMEISILQSIITHASPLPVLCCAAHTWLIWHLLHNDKTILSTNWVEKFWSDYLQLISKETRSTEVIHWKQTTLPHMTAAYQTLASADFSADTFNPFQTEYAGRSGYCLLTLQIAIWAAQWALRNQPLPTPAGFPAEPFQRTGPWTLSWVAMIGHDSDTYGATAGPLIWAAVGDFPKELTDGLHVAQELA